MLMPIMCCGWNAVALLSYFILLVAIVSSTGDTYGFNLTSTCCKVFFSHTGAVLIAFLLVYMFTCLPLILKCNISSYSACSWKHVEFVSLRL